MDQEKDEKEQAHICVPLMIPYAFLFLIVFLEETPSLLPTEMRWSPIPIRFIVSLALIYWYVKRIEKRRFWASIGIKKDGFFNSFIWTFALFLPFILVLGPSYLLAETLVVTHAPPPEFWSPPDWWYHYMIVGAFIPVGLGEEVLFRGFMLDRFLAKGTLFAVAVSSALFSLYHIRNIWLIAYGDYAALGLLGLWMTFITAVYMSTAYYKSRNLVWPIFMHGYGDLIMYPLAHFFGAEAQAFYTFPIAVSAPCIVFLCYRWLRQRRQKKSRTTRMDCDNNHNCSSDCHICAMAIWKTNRTISQGVYNRKEEYKLGLKIAN